MTYTLRIWYAASKENEPQVERGLSEDNVYTGTNAFLSDMVFLEGAGVRKFSVEIEQ